MKLSIPEMSCGHCQSVVERTLAAQGARGVVNLSDRTVVVHQAADPEPLLVALASEGYLAKVIG